MKNRKPVPGHERCRVSTGVHDCLTFGYGELDQYGYWQHGCYECARAYEKKYPQSGPCWPHTKEQIAKLFPAHQSKNVTRMELANRITEYLCLGGMVNPEMMEHQKVRDLLIDVRDYLWK